MEKTESSFIAPNSEKAFEKAAELGLDVVLPKAYEIQLDLDSNDAYIYYLTNIDILLRAGLICNIKDVPSKSGLPHRHITINFNRDLSNWERIAYQASLGSDRTRELLSCIMIEQGDQYPTLFLEKKRSVDS